MTNIIKNLALLFILTLFLGGCDRDKLDELNIDPNNPSAVNIDLLFTAGEDGVLDDFGYNWDRYAGTFVQTFAGNHATGVSADQYLLRNVDFQDMFVGMYKDPFMDLSEVITKGKEQNAWHHVGASKVLLATGLGVLTDVYGDIPFSEAMKGTEFVYPNYDSQESIYNVIIDDLLTTAIADFDNPANTRSLESADFVFNGDVDKWKAVCYTLIARYNNHLSKRDPIGSATKALVAVDAAKAAGMTNDSNFIFPYNGTQNYRNPWYNLYENNLIIASENFMNLLQANPDLPNFDPRLFAFWNDTPYNADPVGFVGKQNGLPTSNLSYSPVGIQGYYGKEDSPQLIATYFELLFIEAEAALRAGDFDRAATAVNDGIVAHFELVEDATLAHMTEYWADEAVALANYNTTKDEYMLAYAGQTASTITLETVMVEKYKAMFTMNVETWVDVRRHDYQYPSYLALPANSNLSDFIRRGLYPQAELNVNPNTPQSVSMLDKLWWDQ